jgi:hypothetical protein
MRRRDDDWNRNDPRQRTYTDPALSSPDPDPKPRTYADPARTRGWSAGSAIGALILLVLIAAGIAYTMNKSSMAGIVLSLPYWPG